MRTLLEDEEAFEHFEARTISLARESSSLPGSFRAFVVTFDEVEIKGTPSLPSVRFLRFPLSPLYAQKVEK
jgi:hypothetical protein